MSETPSDSANRRENGPDQTEGVSAGLFETEYAGKAELPRPEYRSDLNATVAAFADLRAGFSSVRLWSSLAYEEFLRRYSRTALGALWSMASFALWILAISFFFGALASAEANEFTYYVAFGFLVFTYMTTAINEGCATFVSSKQWMQSSRLPLSVFVFKDTARGLIVFFFNAIGAFLVIMFFGYRPEDPVALWAIPGLLILPLNAVWVGLLFGTISARYRDFLHLMQTIMRMAFFMTPIMWHPGDIGRRGIIADFNPMTHYINIVRDPLLYGNPNWHSWQIVIGLTILGWILAIMTFTRSRSRIVFWI